MNSRREYLANSAAAATAGLLGCGGSPPLSRPNVAGEAGNAEVRAALESALQQLVTFQHPFDPSVDPFLDSEQYRKLAANTRAIGTGHIPRMRRDHGKLVWPPE